nr:CBL-interacting serine/threonine-protein kinase 3-like [Ipomoea batatas]
MEAKTIRVIKGARQMPGGQSAKVQYRMGCNSARDGGSNTHLGPINKTGRLKDHDERPNTKPIFGPLTEFHRLRHIKVCVIWISILKEEWFKEGYKPPIFNEMEYANLDDMGGSANNIISKIEQKELQGDFTIHDLNSKQWPLHRRHDFLHGVKLHMLVYEEPVDQRSCLILTCLPVSSVEHGEWLDTNILILQPNNSAPVKELRNIHHRTRNDRKIALSSSSSRITVHLSKSFVASIIEHEMIEK